MSDPASETIIREIHERIAQASGRKGTDDPRTLAFAAIRDGEAWSDRRLPEMGRALDAALDALDALVRERDQAREALKREREWSQRVSERNTDLASRLDEALAALDA